ncbi:MAG: glycosyltransferase family 4 protein [Synergistaceae bacterium]|jgi:glycosyltransferase involved in cell wall biosynthesis
MSGKHLLVVSQYFYPEQFRINDICSEWIKRGYKVTVLTGIPNYPQGKFYKGYGFFKKTKEHYNGMEIRRIPLLPRGTGALMMALNYFSFVVSGFFWSIFTDLNADIVFIYEVSPMTQALPGVWYAKRKKIPCFLYVMDLWPENVEIVGGVKNKTILGLIGKMVNYIYSNCDKIFTSSKSFISAIENRGISKGKIKFWPQYAEECYKPLNKDDNIIGLIPDDGTFNLIFAGNIGYAQGLEILPKAAKILKSEGKRVRFNIVGDGRFKENLISMTVEENVREMFNFIEKQPADKIPEFMSACDAALITLSGSRIFEMTLPAKLQSYLACGIPIVVSGNGEIQEVVKESGAGLYCNAADPEALSQIIAELLSQTDEQMTLLGKNARKFYEENYDRSMLLDKMDKYFIAGSDNRNV